MAAKNIYILHLEKMGEEHRESDSSCINLY